MPRLRLVLVALVACCSVLIGSARQQPPIQYRAAIDLVPVIVRVTDRDGRPVRDLRADAFRVSEDGEPQTILHFEPLSRAGSAPAANASAKPNQQSPERRSYLILLGGGRLQHPTKGVDAAMAFVRQLRVEDRVAVLAYNRATAFTRDRQVILAVLGRFRSAHEGIAAKLQQHFWGWSALYKGIEIPAQLQQEIDEIFAVVGASPRTALRERNARGSDDTEQVRRLLLTDLMQERGEPMPGQPPPARVTEVDMPRPTEAAGMSFDEFMAARQARLHNITALYSGIDYMRVLEGERHILFFTEHAVSFPRAEDDFSLGATAADAGVTINVIQTGGHRLAPGAQKSVLAMAEPLEQRMVVASNRAVATMTGGVAAFYDDAFRATDRILQLTSEGYFLAYAPTRSKPDSRFRRIRVEVARPNTTVVHRAGYWGRVSTLGNPAEQRAYARIASATAAPVGIPDLPLDISVTQEGAEGGNQLRVVVTVRASADMFVAEQDRYLGRLDFAVFCQDSDDNSLGDLWQTMRLALRAETYNRLLTDGVVYRGELVTKRRVRAVKVVVYDSVSDRVGSILRQF